MPVVREGLRVRVPCGPRSSAGPGVGRRFGDPLLVCPAPRPGRSGGWRVGGSATVAYTGLTVGIAVRRAGTGGPKTSGRHGIVWAVEVRVYEANPPLLWVKAFAAAPRPAHSCRAPSRVSSDMYRVRADVATRPGRS